MAIIGMVSYPAQEAMRTGDPSRQEYRPIALE
jgi:hypothetical protein